MSGLPVSPLVERGRLLQAGAGLLLQAAPFLFWAKLPLFGLGLGVPGVLLHGGFLLAIGFTIVMMMLVRVRHPGVSLLLGAAALGVTLMDMRQVRERASTWLAQIQETLSGVNQLLEKFYQPPIRVVPEGFDASGAVDVGAWIAFGASIAVMVGALVEMLGYRRGKKAWSVLIGFPRCTACGARVQWGMSFCPGCALPQRPGTHCEGCDGWMDDWHRFCPHCSRARVTEDTDAEGDHVVS